MIPLQFIIALIRTHGNKEVKELLDYNICIWATLYLLLTLQKLTSTQTAVCVTVFILQRAETELKKSVRAK